MTPNRFSQFSHAVPAVSKSVRALAWEVAAGLSNLFDKEPIDTDIWAAGLDQAQILAATGSPREAESTYRWLIREQPVEKSVSLELARAHNGLAETLVERDATQDAAAAYDTALGILYALPPTIPGVLAEIIRGITGIAELLLQAGDTSSAERVLRQALTVIKHIAGHESPMTITAMQNLARVLYARGNLGEAADLLSSVSQAQIRVLGREHIETRLTLQRLADLLTEQGKITQAKILLHQSESID
jgi:tetratricopeptide (TPR) repeat protein